MSESIKDNEKDNENVDSKASNSADTNVVSDDVTAQSKQEHIKERLKDLGVSEESERPVKSWYGRYGNYMIVTIVVVLSVIYWLESRTMDKNSVQQTAQKDSSVELAQNSNSHVPDVQQNNMMPVNNSQYAQMQQSRMHQNRQHQNEMRKKAWEQQKLRYQQWQKHVREQQEKNRQAWEQYIKQQQAMSQRSQPLNRNGVIPNNRPQMNTNPYFSGPYQAPYGNQNNSGQRNNFQGPVNMQPPQGYQGPPPGYRQPYPNPGYNQRW